VELKAEALDRVLEALSPTLVTELERLVKETHITLEEEFQVRLKEAIREAQISFQKDAEAELQRSIAETSESVRKQVTEELEQGLKKTLDDTTKQLQAEWSAERTRLEDEVRQWRVLAEAQSRFTDASTQAEILARFMKVAQPFAANLAVYVARADGLALWKSRGQSAFPDIISEGITDPESYFRTISVRGKTVAAVCASSPCRREIVDFLVSAVARAIEIFGLKLQSPAPSRVIASSAVAPSGGSPLHADSANDNQSHAEARKTARLLVSEIKLYNEQQLKLGRENNDIYARLQREIDQGREMYKHRVPETILAGHDYFHEELVRILCDNNAARLGPTYPGPVNS
jgi:hypothetical protein